MQVCLGLFLVLNHTTLTDVNNHCYLLGTNQLSVLDLRAFHDRLRNTLCIRHYFIFIVHMRRLEAVS